MANQRATSQTYRSSHTIYEQGDKDAPDCIKDVNGDIVLGLCKICGAGESELYDRPCIQLERIANRPQEHTNQNPLWEGPWGSGPNGGVTKSMINDFLSCRDRFRLKYVLGLRPYDKWNHKIEYGHMWHKCEESYANDEDWVFPLDNYVAELENKYPLYREDINRWHNVCHVQFPEYINYWSEHPDVKNRTPLLQEQVFDVPYKLPSGRTIRLRGKWDAADFIPAHIDNEGHQWPDGVWVQEDKTKGDIDKSQVERQLKYDLQTNLYLIALGIYQVQEGQYRLGGEGISRSWPILGVRYNVVRRPFSGGKGNISPHKAKYTKKKTTPAETQEEFYERLRRDYFVKEPDYWFFRVRAGISQDDLNVFRNETLDPILEQMATWYEQVTGNYQSFKVTNGKVVTPLNYRTPFGVYSVIEEGGFTEYDAYLESGSEAGLRRVNELFTELK